MAAFFKNCKTEMPSHAFAAAKAAFSCAHFSSVTLLDAIIMASIFVFTLCATLVVRVCLISLVLLAVIALANLLVIIIKPPAFRKTVKPFGMS